MLAQTINEPELTYSNTPATCKTVSINLGSGNYTESDVAGCVIFSACTGAYTNFSFGARANYFN